MAIVAGYVKEIAFFMIFAAFIEIIAPSGIYKKYVRLISSLMLIALLLEPIGTLLNAAGLEENYYRLQSSVDNRLISKERQDYEKAHAEAVVAEYKKGLEEAARQVVKAKTGFDIQNVEVIVNEDYGSDSFAEVLGVHATVRVSGNTDNSPAKKVLLGNAAAPGIEEINKENAQIIKNCLMDFYNAPEGNIHITVQGQFEK